MLSRLPNPRCMEETYKFLVGAIRWPPLLLLILNRVPLEYGPPAETQATIVAVNEAGEKLSLTLEHQALRQLAKVFRNIEAEHPGATKGH
jgi:hypothetical protein